MTPPQALVLEATSKADEMAVSLYEQGSTVHHVDQVAVSWPEIERLGDEAIDLLRQATERGPLARELSGRLRKVGLMLHERLLPPSVKQALSQASHGHLIILIDEPLVRIPWELLHDGRTFLCLRFNVGRWVKTSRPRPAVAARPMTRPLHLLVLADPTGDLPDARQEARTIRDELDARGRTITVSTKTAEISLAYVDKHVRDYDLVHYAGHAEFDRLEPSASGWRLCDGVWQAKDVARLGSAVALPWLIFSNACRSAPHGEPVSGPRRAEELFGLANVFLLAGVRHVIGTIWNIPDRTSLVVAGEFYRQLAQGRSIGQALREARLRVVQELGEEHLFWAGYVLYGDPTAVPLPPTTTPRASRLGTLAPRRTTRVLMLTIGTLLAGAGLSALTSGWRAARTDASKASAGADALLRRGEHTRALALLAEALRAHPEQEALHRQLAAAYAGLGRRARALEHLNAAAGLLARRHRRTSELARAHGELGELYVSLGDHDRALAHLRQAEALLRRDPDRHRLVDAKAALLASLLAGDRQAEAEPLLRETVALAAQLGDARAELAGLFAQALLYLSRGEREPLRALTGRIGSSLDAVAPGAWKAGERRRSLRKLASVCYLAGELDRAAEAARALVALDRADQDAFGLCLDEGLLADIHAGRHEYPQAIAHRLESLKHAQAIGDPHHLAQATFALAQRYHELYTNIRLFSVGGFNRLGEPDRFQTGMMDRAAQSEFLDKAIRLYQQALEHVPGQTNERLQAKIYRQLGSGYQAKGEVEQAAQCYAKAAGLVERGEGLSFADRLGRASASIESARLAVTRQDFRAALQQLQQMGPDPAYDGKAWGARELVGAVVKKRLETLLQDVASQGYAHSEFFQQAKRVVERW